MSLSDRNRYEVHAELLQRVEGLERLLLHQSEALRLTSEALWLTELEVERLRAQIAELEGHLT
jgi:hypothetical protein